MYWDPFRVSGLLRSSGGLLGPRPSFVGLRPAPRGDTESPTLPSINVHRTEEGAIVTAVVPGLAPEDLEISVDGDRLTLRGEFRRGFEEREDHPVTRRRRERSEGSFSRSLRLPFPIDREAIAATLERGLLRIDLPRAAADRPIRIEVRSGRDARVDEPQSQIESQPQPESQPQTGEEVQ